MLSRSKLSAFKLRGLTQLARGCIAPGSALPGLKWLGFSLSAARKAVPGFVQVRFELICSYYYKDIQTAMDLTEALAYSPSPSPCSYFFFLPLLSSIDFEAHSRGEEIDLAGLAEKLKLRSSVPRFVGIRFCQEW